MDERFVLETEMTPKGDQPRAIEELVKGVGEGKKAQTLLGVTGSGKTFTAAHVMNAVQKPTLVISHNKTLAAQLFSEFRDFFPENAVEYFVSYYDYYQPEAYIPQTDTYIEKDASINEDLDRLRLSASSSLMSRRDVIVVASVSCIYGLGSPEEYSKMTFQARLGDEVERYTLMHQLTSLQYSRNDYDFKRGTFRARGGVVDVFPAYTERGLRLEFAGDFLERIREINPITGEALAEMEEVTVFPAKHFVFEEDAVERAMRSIEAELVERLEEQRKEGKLLEAERLESRTRYDMEMLREIGYCPGVENYSRHLSGRPPGSRPWTLIDYFPDDFLLIVDESHATIPQLRGMWVGDHNRKETLVEHGFRLPSALDNRPLRFEEFETLVDQAIYVSATPGPYELRATKGEVVEQIIRPTGLVDPPVEIRPASSQIKDLMQELRKTVERKQRALVTTLTKRLAEHVAEYVAEEGLDCTYLHSEMDVIERVEVLRKLREGHFSIVVGVNLLREGLDLPEVALVAVTDADREGFLRSVTSLIQTIGRTARNVDGRVILYADRMTRAIRDTLEETGRRRRRQSDYNEEHGIVPETVRTPIKPSIAEIVKSHHLPMDDVTHVDVAEQIGEFEKEMFRLAEELRFEEAARLRDEILRLQGKPVPERSRRPGWRKKKRKARTWQKRRQ